MTNFEYYITHVFPIGWRTITSAFRIWKDLMTGNYKDYAILHTDDPFEECSGWFWATLGEDDVLPKEFLEYLHQLADDVNSGRVKTYPLTQDMFGELKDLVGDLIEEENDGNV